MNNKVIELNEAELAVIAAIMGVQIVEQKYAMQEGLDDDLSEMQEGLDLMENILSKVNKAMGVGIPNHTHSGPLTLQ